MKLHMNAMGKISNQDNINMNPNESINTNTGTKKKKKRGRPAAKPQAPIHRPTWIWYPGDFEVWLGNQFNNRRTERGAMFPPFWKQDSHWVTVEFSQTVVLEQEETITLAVEGQFNLMIDGKLQFVKPSPKAQEPGTAVPCSLLLATVVIPAGEHRLSLKVWNQATPPALYIKGETVATDNTWLATYEDKMWIDEEGVAHGSGVYVPAGSWNFDSIDTPPSGYALPRRRQEPVSSEQVGDGATLYDFGRETFGYLLVAGLRGCVSVYYGESREEAMDKDHCETLDLLEEGGRLGSKAFRYVLVETAEGSSYDSVSMDYEYAPFDEERSGSFECDDALLNDIWKVAAYTLDLTTREFFVDGIKRDRWTWSGDAVQSYLMNYYLRFDSDCVKRTIRQLRGKDPVTAHINTIMDYTFYWVNSIYDYYSYTGDVDFVREIYPRMRTMMQYVLDRTNEHGMAEGQPDDWIFVDWVEFPMHKRGTLAFEQILLTRSLRTMSRCAKLLSDHPLKEPPQGSITKREYTADFRRYSEMASSLREKVVTWFWSEKRHAFFHAIEDGEMNTQVTKFPNMFAILYNIVDRDRQQEIIRNVILKREINPITTPYMRFYELETLCQLNICDRVLNVIRDYWGGMLRMGATTFWEKYVPQDDDDADSLPNHLSMYGRPYGKSLCHAWGAAPVYLLGKYYLGVKPTKPGYEEYEVRPQLATMKWMRGAVPTPYGLVRVEVTADTITVKSDGGKGTLIAPDGELYPILPRKELTVKYSQQLKPEP